MANQSPPDMDAPVSDDSGVANRSPSEMSDLTGDFMGTTGTPLLRSGKSISGDTEFSNMDAPVLDVSGVLGYGCSRIWMFRCRTIRMNYVKTPEVV